MNDWLPAVTEKLATLAWFVRRPALYPELVRRVTRLRFRTSRSIAAERAALRRGQEWAAARAMPRERALELLGVQPARTLASARPELWREAERRASDVALTMGGPAEIDFLYALTAALRPGVVVETGVAAGWSSFAILAALHEAGTGILESVDMPYPKRDNEHLVGAVVPDALRGRWTLHRRADRDALPAIVRKHPLIDLAHYDSDKSYEGRMFAYTLLWSHLRPGGVLVSDDVEDNLAFADFCASVAKRDPIVIAKVKPGNYAGALRKTSS